MSHMDHRILALYMLPYELDWFIVFLRKTFLSNMAEHQ